MADKITDYFTSYPFIAATDVIAYAFYIFTPQNQRSNTDFKNFKEKINTHIRRHLPSAIHFYAQKNWFNIFYNVPPPDLTKIKLQQQIFTSRRDIDAYTKISASARQLWDVQNPSRHYFSIPSSASSEILQDVFNEIISEHGLSVGYNKLKNLNLLKYPILPMIFRLWYFMPTNTYKGDYPSTYDKFIQYSAYCVASFLITITDITTNETFHLIYVNYNQIYQYSLKHSISKIFLNHLGLFTSHGYGKRAEPFHNEIFQKYYPYWYGDTSKLQELQIDYSTDEIRKSFNFLHIYRRNRFHFMQCDNTNMKIPIIQNNENMQKNRFINPETGFPWIPNIYFAFLSVFAPNRYKIPDLNNFFVFHVSNKCPNCFWEEDVELNHLLLSKQRNTFYPIWYDESLTSVENIYFFDNIYDTNIYTHNNDNQMISNDK